ncbi:MAG: PKD domain-containing protein [Flavobacteriales bacterium]|nr:PKD domain-containing protein [Flavobacteriales bacterium]MBL0034264.1 PKD domain-containing protein [Flavobacteriales bacterium]
MNRWTLLLSAPLFAAALHANDHDHQPGMKAVGGAPADKIRYILNKGQWDPAVLYKAEVTGLAVFLEKDGMVWSKLQDDASERMHDYIHMTQAEQAAFNLKGHSWRMRFVGGDPAAEVTASDRSQAYHNYFIGNDQSKWAGHVPIYGEVMYHAVWPGVDVRMYSKDLNYKYDLVLEKGSAAAQVGFRYEGLEGVSMNEAGDLVFGTTVGTMTEVHPVAWYADGDMQAVTCRFTLNDGVAGFEFGNGTDLERPIVIDPVLMASTLSGTGNLGQTSNYGHSATYDDQGNIFTGARCFGQGYPVTVGAFDTSFNGGGTDISISKLNPDGSALIYATYLGGSDSEYPHSLVTNGLGELYVYGSSLSSNYPTSTGCFDNTFGGGGFAYDIVLTHLNAAGSAIIGSTYVGGPNNDGSNSFTFNYGDSFRGEVIVDAAGNCYVASCTDGAGFPTTAGAIQTTYGGGAQDGVAFCINPNMSTMIWSTYLGGSGGEMCFGIKQDGAGGVFVGGSTSTATFPTTPGAYQTAYQGGAADAFIVHLTNNATTLAGSTFVGTSGEEHAFFLQVDIDGDVYIYGQSDAGTFQIQPATTYGQAGADIFVAKFDPGLTAPIFTSVVGNPGGFGNSLVPVAFLVDVCKHIYISGYSASAGFATSPGALYQSGGFYLASYDVDMASVLYATYYDGANHVDGGTSRFDANGIVYQGVCTIGVFPTTANAYSNVQNGWDVGVFKIDFQVAGVNAAGAGTLNQGCAPIQIDFLNTSTGDSWIWDFGDGSAPDTAYAPSHTYTTPGAYTVTLIAFDSLSCNLADTITFPVTIGQSQPITAAFSIVQNTDCTISQVLTTNNSTGSPLAFVWDMGDGTFLTDTNVVHNYSGPGTYDIELLAYDPTGCSQPDSLTIPFTVLPPVEVEALFTVTQVPDCDDLIVTTDNTSTGPGPITYSWDMGDGSPLLNSTNVTYTYSGAGTYTITLIANDANTCNQADTADTQVTVDPTIPVTAGFSVDQVFNCAQLLATTTNTSTGTFLGFSWDMGDGTALLNDTNVTHTYLNDGTYTVTLVVTDLLGCSPNDTATAVLVVDPLIPVVADFTLAQVNACTQLQVASTNLSTGDSIAFSWDMGDGTVLTTTNVSYSYTTPGTYTVTLTVTDLACGQTDQMSLPIDVINTIPVAVVGPEAICPGSSVQLSASPSGPGYTYYWNNGSTMSTITVSQAAQYVLEVYTANCMGTTTVTVIEAPDPEMSQRFDGCPDERYLLSVPLEGQSYQWNTGGTDRDEAVVGPGEYIFTVIDQYGCSHTDTITIDALDADARLFAPNAFTPDGDGINDVFTIGGYGEKEVDLMIFDRWGEQLYQTTSLLRPWDGTYNGQPVKQDVYVYVLKYNAVCKQSEFTTARGHVSVLR